MNVLPLVLAAAASAGTVTIPLSEAPALLNPPADKAEKPPVDVLLVEQSLKAKPGQDGLTVDAQFVVQVLAERTWCQLPLLPLGPDVVVVSAHVGEGATVAPRNGQLAFLSKQDGRYTVDARLLVRARPDGAGRVASLAAPAGSGVVPLSVEADPGIFELQGSDEVFPAEGRYAVRWRPRTELARDEKREPPPPLEPRVKQLSATWVTTLEGRVTARLTYALTLDRPQPFEVTIPAGQTLESVRVNGQVVPAAPGGKVLKLQVAPVRLGETGGTVELRLAENIGVFHLAGTLRVALPSASWQTDSVGLRTYLPTVFEYRRTGGSLEEGAAGTLPSEVLPGRELAYRQFLVTASSPSVELRYSVDISKSYFR